MKWTYDDGGRAAAGFKGSTGDCVARAVAIALELPYREVYDALAAGNAAQRVTKHSRAATARRRTAANGIFVRRLWFERYMRGHGWTWTPTMHVGSGCTVHLVAEELPAGRLVVSLSKHYAAVIDGVLHDTYDSSERGTTVYPLNCSDLPKKAMLHPDGDCWLYTPERCVYGYWSKT